LAGFVEGLSPEARRYFVAGGLGILIGDGKLNYREEKVLETYYAFGFNKWTTLTFDYQLIGNPGYNADRGPGVALLRAISCRVLRTLPLPSDLTHAESIIRLSRLEPVNIDVDAYLDADDQILPL
jgi:hypothetical protein